VCILQSAAVNICKYGSDNKMASHGPVYDTQVIDPRPQKIFVSIFCQTNVLRWISCCSKIHNFSGNQLQFEEQLLSLISKIRLFDHRWGKCESSKVIDLNARTSGTTKLGSSKFLSAVFYYKSNLVAFDGLQQVTVGSKPQGVRWMSDRYVFSMPISKSNINPLRNANNRME
jgi:hypothetical protein